MPHHAETVVQFQVGTCVPLHAPPSPGAPQAPVRAPFVASPPPFSWWAYWHETDGESATQNKLGGATTTLPAYSCS